MSVTNGERLATKQDLADMYQGILPYLGGMPEMVANKFSKGDLYSTDEKMIGQWINGKPLYQRVIPVTGTYSGLIYDQTIATISDYNFIDTVVQFFGYVRGLKSGTSVSGPICYPHPSADWITNAYIDESGVIKICNGKSTRITNPIFIIQYTKTTDSAISIGSDTDYSTEEKIVGTWIDDSPVYQKTIDCGALPNASAKTISHGVSNIDVILSMNGIAYYSDKSQFIRIPYVADSSATTNQIQLNVHRTNGITIACRGVNYSNYTSSYVTIQYTKTTT